MRAVFFLERRVALVQLTLNHLALQTQPTALGRRMKPFPGVPSPGSLTCHLVWQMARINTARHSFFSR
jgi:hypothetical protein